MAIVKSHKEFIDKLLNARYGLIAAGLRPYYLVIHPARRIISECVIYRSHIFYTKELPKKIPKWEAKIFNLEIVKDVNIKATEAILMTKTRHRLFAIKFPFHKDELEIEDC